jgi:hypothetical protein
MRSGDGFLGVGSPFTVPLTGARRPCRTVGAMTTIMLDTNCLIDLEQGRQPHAEQLRQVLAAWRRGEFEVVLGAITASENAKPGEEPSFEAFERLRELAGVADARLLPPMMIWEITYWDEALWTDDESEALEAKVHAILAPGLAMDDRSDAYRWLNVKCDVQLVWTAIWHRVDVLVTRDQDIVKKADALADLGANVQSLAAFATRLGN